MVCEICEVKGIIGIWIYIVFFFWKNCLDWNSVEETYLEG